MNRKESPMMPEEKTLRDAFEANLKSCVDLEVEIYDLVASGNPDTSMQHRKMGCGMEALKYLLGNLIIYKADIIRSTTSLKKRNLERETR
jgi:hypothetical protein